MHFRLAIVCLLVVLVPGHAAAHGNLQHVMGTVKSISPDSVVISVGAESKEVTVMLLPSTKFEKSGADSSLKELKVGDRVVIHAKPDGDRLDAVTVAFGKTHAHPNATTVSH